MASWGDFIKEIPIINKRSEGMFVKVDHVLDLWEERNKLRRELAQLQGGGGGSTAGPDDLQAAAAAEREACAAEVEEMAEAIAEEPDSNEQLVTMLHAVARLLREKGAADAEEAPMAEPLDGEAADAPMAEPMEADASAEPAAVESETPPMAEPVEAEAPPMAEPLEAEPETPPMAEPLAEETAPAAGPTLADLLNRHRAPS